MFRANYVFTVNFKQISHVEVSIVDFQQINTAGIRQLKTWRTKNIDKTLLTWFTMNFFQYMNLDAENRPKYWKKLHLMGFFQNLSVEIDLKPKIFIKTPTRVAMLWTFLFSTSS